MEDFKVCLTLEKEIKENEIIDYLNKYIKTNSIEYNNNQYNIKNIEVIEKMNRYILVIDLEA